MRFSFCAISFVPLRQLDVDRLHADYLRSWINRASAFHVESQRDGEIRVDYVIESDLDYPGNRAALLSRRYDAGSKRRNRMTAVPNHALRQLRAGKLAIGLGVQQARTVAIAQIAKTSGFDWMFIDCEHSSMDLDTAAQVAEIGVRPRFSLPTPFRPPCG